MRRRQGAANAQAGAGGIDIDIPCTFEQRQRRLAAGDGIHTGGTVAPGAGSEGPGMAVSPRDQTSSVTSAGRARGHTGSASSLALRIGAFLLSVICLWIYEALKMECRCGFKGARMDSEHNVICMSTALAGSVVLWFKITVICQLVQLSVSVWERYGYVNWISTFWRALISWNCDQLLALAAFVTVSTLVWEGKATDNIVNPEKSNSVCVPFLAIGVLGCALIVVLFGLVGHSLFRVRALASS